MWYTDKPTHERADEHIEGPTERQITMRLQSNYFEDVFLSILSSYCPKKMALKGQHNIQQNQLKVWNSPTVVRHIFYQSLMAVIQGCLSQ